MEAMEDIVLRHSQRGMTVLKKYMKQNYCKRAAGKLLSLRRGTVLLTTGFYVKGHAETDGPLGTMMTAKALQKLGFHAVIVTDRYCRSFFEPEGLEVEYVDIDAEKEVYEELLNRHRPAALISIERCGHNVRGDYANMRGISIADQTAKTDFLFELAKQKEIPTFGVGDGGNEIGMGNVKDIIATKLSLVPCTVTVDYLMIATVSNWGAYALVAYLQELTGRRLLLDYEEVREYLERIVALGSVDGTNGKCIPTVDGFSLDVEKEILDALHERADLSLTRRRIS